MRGARKYPTARRVFNGSELVTFSWTFSDICSLSPALGLYTVHGEERDGHTIPSDGRVVLHSSTRPAGQDREQIHARRDSAILA